MDNEGRCALIECTPERRAGVLRIKLMIDEAHRLREDDNICGYAMQVADIDLALAKLDPECSDKIPEIEKSAIFYRSLGHEPSYPAKEWRKDNFTHLDKTLHSISKCLTHFENQLRIGFGAKLSAPEGVGKYI